MASIRHPIDFHLDEGAFDVLPDECCSDSVLHSIRIVGGALLAQPMSAQP